VAKLAIEGQAEVGSFLGTKGLEELNSLRVLDLFKRMPAEVRAASLSLSHSLTTLAVRLRISRSQADSHKTGRVFVAIYSRTPGYNTTFGCSRRGQVGHSFHGSVLVPDISPATKMIVKLAEVIFTNAMIREQFNNGMSTSLLVVSLIAYR